MDEMMTVGVSELRADLSRFLERVRFGEEIVVVSRGVAVARLLPPAPAHTPDGKRRLGLLKGKIWIGDDFDETPREIIDAMESDGEP